MYREGYDTIDVAADTLKWGYWTASDSTADGYFMAVRVVVDPNAAYSAMVYWYRDGSLKRTQIAWPGFNIYDAFYCDSVVVIKDAATDTVQIGGQW